MDLIKCPRCGEEFSPSYRKCPFCEEGDHPRRRVKYSGGKKNGGRRVSDRKRTHSAGGAVTAVLIVVLMLLSWSLFGEQIVAKLGGGTNDTEQTDDAAQIGGEVVSLPDADGNGGTETDGGDVSAPPEVNGADGSGTSTQTDTGTETADNGTAAVDASALSVKTSVGTTLPKDAGGSFDCTIKQSESIRLIVSGTDAAVTWTAADTSVLTVSSDGKLSPLKAGTTTVTASVGGASLHITVRVK